ncbi:hypothetical protein ABZ611_14380 [Streptomyces sp. NPDC007861]|uniref:hypothetical protein n=1 Tax=Streptomyces sp. NPDC007861 TaxID=3154893 RepID=UPI003404F471
MIRTRLAQAAAVATVVAGALLAAPAALDSGANTVPSAAAHTDDMGWQVTPADMGWQ